VYSPGMLNIGSGELYIVNGRHAVRMVQFQREKLRMEPIRQVLAVLLVLGLLGGALYCSAPREPPGLTVKGFGRSANRQMRS